MWRKGGFGAGSRGYPAAGNTFEAKILTASAICCQLERQFLTYLTNAVIAYRGGRPAPSLLPAMGDLEDATIFLLSLNPDLKYGDYAAELDTPDLGERLL